ncbi:MAG: 50S ribosomal protein L2 [Candidatus Peregrinibacteria bacterium GW2011_GWA2_47_7]|nr:MAG: 50S ribosomal protein L2 [Candidatus Peregrinibacteria bacterium GW2011_GWA2_47_7]
MPIKEYKPVTPGRRGMSVLTYEELTQKRASLDVSLLLNTIRIAPVS